MTRTTLTLSALIGLLTSGCTDYKLSQQTPAVQGDAEEEEDRPPSFIPADTDTADPLDTGDPPPDSGLTDTGQAATEECDGIDNDGDGQIDEGFDEDGDDIPDCQEVEYSVDLNITADDVWEGSVDGEHLGNQHGWSQMDSYSFVLDSGPHVITMNIEDTGEVIMALQAQLTIHGWGEILTGDGDWVLVTSPPGTGWENAAFNDSAWTTATPCADISPWGGEPAELLSAGAQWIGAHPGGDCQSTLDETWFRLRLDLP